MTDKTFDPGQHLTKIKGQDYLEVKWRLAWLRAEHPDAILETDMRVHENGRAVFWARVALPGGAVATGWGSCTIDEFDNYIEKAETKAIGRAIASIGFGTQFAVDEYDGVIADAPVGFAGSGASGPPRGGGGGGDLATSAQKSMIQYKARQAQLEPDELVQFIQQQTGKGFNELTKRDASRVIDAFSSMPPPQQRPPQPPQQMDGLNPTDAELAASNPGRFRN